MSLTAQWTKQAEDYDVLAGEYYDLWVDYQFTQYEAEAECAWSHYLEQLKRAKYARKRALQCK